MAEYTLNNTTNGEPKGPPQACLFVANLPSPPLSSSSSSSNTTTLSSSLASPPSPTTEVSEERIREHFSQFGTVLKVKLIKDRSSRPYAFVQFCEVDDAAEALKSNKLFDGKRLRVERAKVNRTLFIAKLSRNTTNSALREQAQKFGPVESVTIIKNHQTNRSKGCGFVKYIYREDAMDAFVGIKNVNHKWVVEWATSTNDPDTLGVDKYNVFLGGLNPDEVTKESIEARFGEYGEIESVSLVNKEDDEGDEVASLGARSAFAFVRFTDPSASSAAIEAENGAEWLGRRIRVQYCESPEMKNKRRLTKFVDSQPYGSPPNLPSVPQFYGSGQVMEPPRAMMMMGGMPIYNMPPTSNTSKGPYGARSKGVSVGEPIYTGMGAGYPLNPLLAYSQPWLFQQMPQQIPQQHAMHLMPQQSLHTGRAMHSIPMQPMAHMQHFPPQQHFHQPVQHSHTLPTHHNQHSPRSHHQNHQNHSPHQNHQPQQTQAHHVPQANHQQGRSLPSLQRNRERPTSPNSDDSSGIDGDGGLTQSVAGWVLK